MENTEKKCRDGYIKPHVENLKLLRKKAGLSQFRLSDSLMDCRRYVSSATIKRVETGGVMTYRTAGLLAQFYNVDVDFITQAVA
jgi:transcriptional regulator with XRE-family HTH domain